jgi:3-hydroxyisobutyrate dehydrogenase
MAQIAFVGLGVMGAPMARHLIAAGHAVTVYNRTPQKAEAFAAATGAGLATRLEVAAEGAEVACLCLGNDADSRAVTQMVLPVMAADGVVVDHTTTSAQVAVELAALAQSCGRHFVDAPVSGGQAGAEAGRLTAMLGGDPAAITRITPMLEAYAKTIVPIGPAGSGQRAKMVNQICIAGVVQGLSEGIAFAKAQGLDLEAVFAAISKGAAASWQMDNRWGSMSEGQFDFGFAVDLMRKDLGLVLAEGRAAGARLPLTALVDQFYADVQAKGGGRWDTSSLITRLTD